MYLVYVARIAVVGLLALPTPTVALPMGSVASDVEYTIMSRFFRAIDAYVVHHHRMFEPLAEGIMCLPEDTLAAVNGLAEIPREARPVPREGEIFTADVADLFGRRLVETFYRDEYSAADRLTAMDAKTLTAPGVRVNEPLPWGIGNILVPAVDIALPSLPEELEYRLVGHDLVLIDVVSNIVVDVIRTALPLY